MYNRIPIMKIRIRPAARVLGFLALVWLSGHMLHVHADPGSGSAPVAEAEFLDVGLLIFDPGIPADQSTHSKLGIFPEIRKSEAKYMPVILREVLINSGEWGVVRVLPEALESSELLVTGTILHSDGLRLSLSITARDASGAGAGRSLH